MKTIKDFLIKYNQQLDHLDLELIIARALGRSREFVLAHPEKKITKKQETIIKNFIERRIKCEPLAYILGEKEFYGMKYKVNKYVLIPRPETELIVELAINKIKNKKTQDTRGKIQNTIIVDIGTGSGNIIISLTKKLITDNLQHNFKFFGIDISKKALSVAKQNAKLNKVDKKIKFLRGNLLEPIIKKRSTLHAPRSMIITANLPYLSPKIYNSAPKSVRNYEPKLALISQNKGLSHYDKLLKQVKDLKRNCSMFYVLCFMEIGPEQKNKIGELIKKYFPNVKIKFHKDLSGKWRVCQLEILNSKF